MVGVYIHIPFCLRRCGYCDFCSSVASQDRISEYADAVVRNVLSYSGRGFCADTVYLGGGTPSLLSASDMEKIMSAVADAFELTPDVEITTEANPCSVDLEKLRAYRESGINRISFGIQSCKDNELYTLGRLHSYAQAVEAVENAKTAGIENISCDLMLGIPYQTMESLAESVEAICSLGVKHISTYMLKIEEGTEFDCDAIRALVADDDTVAKMYLDIAQRLIKRGFEHYEISNFAVRGYESRHNLKYWNGDEYIGIGPSAHSYFEGGRFYVPEDIDLFIESPLQETLVEDEQPDKLLEYIMLGLRLSKGIFLDRVISLVGDAQSLVKAAEPFVKVGYITISESSIALTTEGFLVSNGIISRLLDSQI